MELHTGAVFSRALHNLTAKPLFFFALAFVVMFPVAILSPMKEELPNANLYALIAHLAEILMRAVFAYATFQIDRGREVSPGEALAAPIRRFIPLVFTLFLMGFCISLGFALLILPGLILLCMWYVAMAACIVDGTGPIESLRRSARLTKGHRLRILWLGFLSLLIVVTIEIAAGAAIGLTMAGAPRLAQFAAMAALLALPTAYLSVLNCTIYCVLREIETPAL